MSLLSFFPCSSCKHRDRSPDKPDTAEISSINPSTTKPISREDLLKEAAKTPAAESSSTKTPAAESSSTKKPEERICPITGAVGYCPMARPPPGQKLPDVMPELKVMMFLLWEDDGSKVSVGVYPHMSQHWEALDIPDTSTKKEIKAQFYKLSLKYHPDKNREEGAAERFKEITEANQALKDVDGTLSFPFDKYPERQHAMTGLEVLKTFGPLAAEAARLDPIKAQMMQHVVKEATDCKVLMYEREALEAGFRTKETWADGLCEDKRNGSNHLVKVYRRIVSLDPDAPAAGASGGYMTATDSTQAPSETQALPSESD